MNIEAIIIACSKLIERYNLIEDKNVSIDEMLTILDKLAGYIFFLREAAGQAEYDYILFKTSCEAEQCKQITEKLKESTGKPTMSKLEREVEFENLGAILKYRTAEADHARFKNIVLGVEGTIKSIEHRINYYKFDRKNNS